MSLYKSARWCCLLLSLVAPIAGYGFGESVNLGTPLTEAEIERVDITIFPNGHNLPVGRGSVTEGRQVYFERCALCHGDSGTEGPSHRLTGSVGLFSIWDPLRIKRIQEVNGLLVMSTGQQWPYATTIFDYVRRAMPHVNPKSLSNNQVYAITAYILYLNELVDESFTVDRTNLPSIEMPALKRFVRAK
ncbi:MAG: cytochrome c [Halieaceae bacterium]|jgi:S-disulfanyl-L-cysteine oxidoreductase SoxD|nr:cytochrome c [Halieaceae bacterium]